MYNKSCQTFLIEAPQNIDQITDTYNTFILPQILSSDCLGGIYVVG